MIGKITFQDSMIHKIQCLRPCYLISFYVTYFLKMKIIILEIKLTTPYSVGSTATEVLENISGITKKLFTWFAYNQMKANDDKCHLILLPPDDSAVIQI